MDRYVDAWFVRHQVDITPTSDVDSNERNFEGKKHLHLAARKGQFLVMKLLYRVSIVLTRTESHGMTPSELAGSHKSSSLYR